MKGKPIQNKCLGQKLIISLNEQDCGCLRYKNHNRVH